MKFATRMRGWRKSASSAWQRWRYGFGPDQLLTALRQVGIAVGDVVLVHSSIDRFGAFRGTTVDILATLKRAVGDSGTLLMPTIPFTGTAVDFVQSGQVFDVRRTPSRVGLLTELFRRSDGVTRSVHPTHPVAAWGALAKELLEDHLHSDTPCGPHSPYGRLVDRHGKIVLLGVGIDSFTFFHAIEARLQEQMPFSPFTLEVFEVKCLTADGRAVTARTRLFEPAVSRRRNIGKLVPELKAIGAWNEARAGNLSVIAIPAAESLEAAQRLAARGIYCYD
jgi:aminoglycoside 3-N-acetyltransferase